MDPAVPDIYCDGVQVGLSPFTALLTFSVQPPQHSGARGPTPVANVRMSLEHAKILSIMLRKQLKTFETQFSVEVQIPQEVYRQLGMSKQEDW
jgi:hypothetical protein